MGLKTILATLIATVSLNLTGYAQIGENLGNERCTDIDIVVNRAENTLSLQCEGEEVLESKIITGKRNWRTPLGEYTISRIKVNPRWTIPKRIEEEMSSNKPETWNYRVEHEIYKLDNSGTYYQKGSPYNPLGQLAMPLDQLPGILIHDTNNKISFEREANRRYLSHGCIRTEKVRDIVYYLMDNIEYKPEISKTYLNAILKGNGRRYRSGTIKLAEPIDVRIIHEHNN